VARLRIYTNESVHIAVAIGLRQRGIDAWSARDIGNLGLSDEEQLAYANQERSVIFTHNHGFIKLAHNWAQQSKEHWGVIYIHQEAFSIGECIRTS
jgi:predicted nuclease of predicted toxin-antitoxin system